jgi:hypothetical protein
VIKVSKEANGEVLFPRIYSKDIEDLVTIFKEKSPKTARAVKKFMIHGRKALDKNEADLLFKLKKKRLKLEEKINHLNCEKQIIDLLTKIGEE